MNASDKMRKTWYGKVSYHEGVAIMGTRKIAITIDESLLKRLDQLVEAEQYPSRSRAIQEAVNEKLSRLDQTRLIRELAKLDPVYEQELADEGLAEDLSQWPEY